MSKKCPLGCIHPHEMLGYCECELKKALEEIAGCDGGKGFMPELARAALTDVDTSDARVTCDCYDDGVMGAVGPSCSSGCLGGTGYPCDCPRKGEQRTNDAPVKNTRHTCDARFGCAECGRLPIGAARTQEAKGITCNDDGAHGPWSVRKSSGRWGGEGGPPIEIELLIECKKCGYWPGNVPEAIERALNVKGVPRVDNPRIVSDEVEARIAQHVRVQTRERCAQELYDQARRERDAGRGTRAMHTEACARRLQGVDDDGKVIAMSDARTDYGPSKDTCDHCPNCGVYTGEGDHDFACAPGKTHEWQTIAGVSVTCECGDKHRHRCPIALVRHLAARDTAKATATPEVGCSRPDSICNCPSCSK